MCIFTFAPTITQVSVRYVYIYVRRGFYSSRVHDAFETISLLSVKVSSVKVKKVKYV